MDALYMITLVFLLHNVLDTDGICQDLSTNACILMHKEDPNICSNSALAESACLDFCNLCPLTCYDCDNISSNAADCVSMKVCGVGEQCLLAKYRASADGHYEYKMNCANDNHCEGREYLNVIGRRGIEQRTISTECCRENLCNNPAFYMTTPLPKTTTAATTATTRTTTTPTTTYCNRDIDFVIHDSSAQSGADVTEIRNFLKGIFSRIMISPNGNMVAYATFDTSLHNHIDFESNRYTLNQGIDSVNFTHRRADVDITHVTDNIFSKFGGRGSYGRPDVEDVFLFIFDKTAADHLHHHHGLPNALPGNVIVIGVGSGNLATPFTSLAKDAAHSLSVTDYNLLPTLENQILSLMCS